jgi:hypothetical protein
MSKMSAWLGFPLEEGHSGEKIKLRKTGQAEAYTTDTGLCKRHATAKGFHQIHSSLQKISAVTFLLPKPITKRSQTFQTHTQPKTESLQGVPVTFSLWVLQRHNAVLMP